MSLVVGIDLGTCNSCVALYRNGQVKIIENNEHKQTTPSFVFYGEEGISVGNTAINRSAIKPENGIFDAKRLIGRKYNDPAVLKNIRKWPFEVIKEHQDEPLIRLVQNGQKVELRPEEVSAEVLKKLKNDASDRIGEKIEKVVITVPAYFTNPQKQATINAAKIAGLTVLKLISEPTAAALAFTQDGDNINNKTVLIYDLGGGTFDVSILKFKNNEGEVIAHAGHTSLGGRDFDNNLVKHCMDVIREQYQYSLVEQKQSTQRRGRRRLKIRCEELKKNLSTLQKATLELDQFDGHEFEITITRQKFEELNEFLFQKTIKIVHDLLSNSKISKNQIDDVILVGGSTRIPRIRKLVQDYFEGKPLNQRVNPDEAVAIGAALQASNLSKHPQQLNQIWKLTDVTPFSIGIEVADHTMSVIIAKSSEIPALGEKRYKTTNNKQEEINLQIYEGENRLVKDNIALGELKIAGITPKKAGKVEVIVTLHVDLNGILSVTAGETSKGIVKNLEISLDRATST